LPAGSPQFQFFLILIELFCILTFSPAQLRLLSAAKFGTVIGQNSTAELTRGNLRFRYLPGSTSANSI
jgi:hypothetical protein